MGAEPGASQRMPLQARLGAAPTLLTGALAAALVALGLLLAHLATGSAMLASPAATQGALARVAWWQLAVVFALAGSFAFHVEINSEAHTFSLSEVPLALGLFFASPRDLVIARVIGEAMLLVTKRQSPTKLAFNLSLFFAESTTALAIFRVVSSTADPLHPRAWFALLPAVGAGALIGVSAVWIVIRIHGGEVRSGQLIMVAAATTVGNTSLAVIAAVLLRIDPAGLAPLAVIALIVVAGYRGYTRLARRYDGLELLYQFTRITGGPQRPEATLQRVLEEASRLLRTERALIALYHADDDRPWIHLGITNRKGQSPTAERIEDVDLPAAVRRQVLDDGRPMLIPRTTKDAAARQVLEAFAAQDLIAAPLLAGGRTSGVLVVCDRLGESSTFDVEDSRLFATLASQAAIALENGRLIERLQEQALAREHEALHDALTKLPNRRLFSEALTAALADPAQTCLGVLLMDLDGFKEVNDTLGHHAGDLLLCQVADRLRETVGDRGTVARLGGDEFAVMLPALDSPEAAEQLAEAVNAALRHPIRLAAMDLEIGGSIGVATFPDHGDDPSLLLQRADVAMYTAKQTLRGVARYDPETDWNSQKRLQMAGELRQALEHGEIEVWYQPLARTSDCAVIGAEALVRWNHPTMGRINPDDFIPIAERSGLIHDLTVFVLGEALAQHRAWRRAGFELGVAVNLAPQVLHDVGWAAKVADLLHRHGVAPHWLTFEITESGIMTDPQRMIGMLHHLATAGIEFAIDDFGTGYSSLSYLQRLPVSKVKIDKSFVIPMAQDAGAATIVRSVIDLASALSLTVVAEGVEDAATLELLRAVDCAFIQGYHLSRPLPPAEFTERVLGVRPQPQDLEAAAPLNP